MTATEELDFDLYEIEEGKRDEYDENWETVYRYCVWRKTEQGRGGALEGGHYFQTFGGGPEGGYVLVGRKTVYAVRRGWGTRWTYRKIANKRLGIVSMPDGEIKVKTLAGS
jgi:hypothetical protein